MSPPTAEPEDPPSEVEFARARRAVELGLATEAEVEAALLADDRGAPGPRGIISRLGLLEAQRTALVAGRPPPPEVAAALRDPKRLVSRFVIVEPVGKGGMADVFRAWDPRLGRFVALKLLRRMDDDRARACFEREARLAAGLCLPSVAAIHEIGEHEGRPYIAMELVEGETLARAGRDAGPRRAAELIRDAARAVDAAHRRGVVHRDLKPSNLMVRGDGRVVVLDFGLARPVEEGAPGSTLTGTGVVAGTPEYMAPEQARGGRGASIDARTDVYALGACLFELLTGRPPFVSEERGETIARVLRDAPPRPRALAPDVPAPLEAIALRCLEKDPARRYESAGALAGDLDRFLAGERVAARAGGPSRRALAASLLAGVAVLGAIGWATAGAVAARRARPPGAPAGPAAAAAAAPAPAPAAPRVTLVLRDPSIEGFTALAVGDDRLYFGATERPFHAVLATVPLGGGPRTDLGEVPDYATGLVLTGDSIFWCDMNSAPPDYGSRVYRARRDAIHDRTVIYESPPRGTPIEDVSGLVSDGTWLYAVDQVGGRVWRLGFDGSDLTRIAGERYGGGFATEHRNGIDVRHGAVVVASAGIVASFGPEVVAIPAAGGEPRRLHLGPPLVRPEGVAIGPDGTVYISDPGAGNAIWMLDLERGGPPRILVAGPPFLEIRFLAISPRGDALYVADTGDGADGRGSPVPGPGAIYRIDLSR